MVFTSRLNEAAPSSIQRYTDMIEEYIDTVTTHTTAVCFIAMGTLQNCLNEVALLSIQRYAHITEEYTETVTTPTKAACFIAT